VIAVLLVSALWLITRVTVVVSSYSSPGSVPAIGVFMEDLVIDGELTAHHSYTDFWSERVVIGRSRAMTFTEFADEIKVTRSMLHTAEWYNRILERFPRRLRTAHQFDDNDQCFVAIKHSTNPKPYWFDGMFSPGDGFFVLVVDHPTRRTQEDIDTLRPVVPQE
jgi:hypothetical protein